MTPKFPFRDPKNSLKLSMFALMTSYIQMENRKIINSIHVGFSVKNSVDVGFITSINRLSN